MLTVGAAEGLLGVESCPVVLQTEPSDSSQALWVSGVLRLERLTQCHSHPAPGPGKAWLGSLKGLGLLTGWQQNGSGGDYWDGRVGASLGQDLGGGRGVSHKWALCCESLSSLMHGSGFVLHFAVEGVYNINRQANI